MEKEITLVKSRILPSHSEVDKGGTYEEDSGSTEVDEEEEAREFNYYMTRQARNSARGKQSKEGIRVKGRSTRNPSGI